VSHILEGGKLISYKQASFFKGISDFCNGGEFFQLMSWVSQSSSSPPQTGISVLCNEGEIVSPVFKHSCYKLLAMLLM